MPCVLGFFFGSTLRYTSATYTEYITSYAYITPRRRLASTWRQTYERTVVVNARGWRDGFCLDSKERVWARETEREWEWVQFMCLYFEATRYPFANMYICSILANARTYTRTNVHGPQTAQQQCVWGWDMWRTDFTLFKRRNDNAKERTRRVRRRASLILIVLSWVLLHTNDDFLCVRLRKSAIIIMDWAIIQMLNEIYIP